jgi:hypothetical protein
MHRITGTQSARPFFGNMFAPHRRAGNMQYIFISPYLRAEPLAADVRFTDEAEM